MQSRPKACIRDPASIRGNTVWGSLDKEVTKQRDFVSFSNIKNPKYTFCREFNSEYKLWVLLRWRHYDVIYKHEICWCCWWSRPIRNSVLLFVFLWAKGLITFALQSGLGPSDYHLFQWIKKLLIGQKFTSHTIPKCNQSFISGYWLWQQLASFFASNIQKLVDRWDKCLDELVEKWNSYI